MSIGLLIATINWKEKICEFLIEKGVCMAVAWAYKKVKPTPIEKAYKEALKRWNTHHYVRGYYKQHRLETLEEFSQYVMSMDDLHGDADMNELFRLIEEELKKDEKTYNALIELREKAIELGVEKLLKEVIGIHGKLDEHTALLHEIKKKLSSHNKGQREPFDCPETYIQRYCSQRLETDDYVRYFLEHKEIRSYPLIDFVLGNADCSSKKYILFSDAHAGKTTELRKLCYDVQENGMFVPILYEVKHHPNLLQDLPALDDDDDGEIVLVIDALDERFDGDERSQLFREIEGYAKEHRQIRIVLSCRSNIKKECEMEGFKPLMLDGIKQEDAINYLQVRNQEALAEEIKQSGIIELTRTPFSLIAISDYYHENKHLPANKPELYDYFIDRKLKRELTKISGRKARKLRKGLEILQALAVALQLMDVNQLCEDKVYYLMGEDDEMLDATLRTSFIELTEEGGYGFVHNTYKEHFVAKYLYQIGDLEKIQQICCYSRTKTVKTSWYNTVALMLSSMPKADALSDEIMNWIVNDNKEMVLYIDQQMLSEEQRTSVLIEILENCKKKNVRFGDFYTSQYKELLEFGNSQETIDYIEKELKSCKKKDCHLINLMFMIHHLRWETLSENRSKKLKRTMLSTFGRLIKIEEVAYPLFVAFRNPRLMRKDVVDYIYEKIKDSTQPDVLNQFVEYVNESGDTEDYIDVIIGMSKHIHDYRRHGATCCVTKVHLHDCYKAVATWKNIQKVLRHLTKEVTEHKYYYDGDIRELNEVISELLNKVAQMTKTNPKRADFVFDELIQMAEERRELKSVGTDPFVAFFEKTNTTQHYFELSLEKLKEKLFDRQEWGGKSYEYHRLLEAYAYSTSLFLTEDRVDEICREYESNSIEGYSLLNWIKQTASEEMREVIETKQKSQYPSHWIDPHKPSIWDVKRQKDYDEFMDFERFKAVVMKVVQDKSPKSKEDIKALRKVKVKFSDGEEDRINQYVFSILYDFTQEDNSVDLAGMSAFISNEKSYHRLVVEKTVERLYQGDRNVKLTGEQKTVFESAVREILREMSDAPFDWQCLHKSPAISALLHHDVSVDKDILLKLLPYSGNSIYIRGKMNFGCYYYLFDYIREQLKEDEQIFYRALQECMEKPEVQVEDNLKLWGKYLIKTGKTLEIPRIKKWLKVMDDGDAAYTIIKAMTERADMRKIVMTATFVRGLSIEKKEYVYELLASDDSLDDFVKNGIERLFYRLDAGCKGRAIYYLFAKGSVKALRYLARHLDMFGRNYAMNYHSIEALPLLLKIYVSTIDRQPRHDYSCLLNAIEMIAATSDYNWKTVKKDIEKLISQDQKYVGLNWYLDKWERQYWERQTRGMSFEEVKETIGLWASGK